MRPDTILIQVRQVIYREIASSLRGAIESGEYPAGALLPSEAEFCATHGVSRVTVRKALELLREEGLVTSRQGFGWLVAGKPLTQSLDSLVSIERQLGQQGRSLRREVTDFAFIETPTQAALLGPRVLQVGRLNLVDDLPFARIVVWCREDLASDLSRSQVTNTSFLDLLGQLPQRAVQTIGAHAVPRAEAKLLAVPEGSPALLVRRTTYDSDGVALLMSEHWLPGHLTEFVAELTIGSNLGNELRLVADS